MDTVIKGGRIVTATETYEADIGIEKGQIALLGRNLEGDETIDAKGMFVLPGGIDPHTHLELPFMGTVSADDFRTGTIAAACGGTTTIIDFAIQGKGQTLREALEIWLKKAEGKASVDYGFHVAIGAMDDARMAEMGELVRDGVSSFKIFMAYKGTFMVDDETLFRALLRAREVGALITVHAENGDVLNYLINKHVAEGKKEPIWHALSHPPEAEAEATHRAIVLAGLAGAPIYFVHMSAAEALEALKAGRAKGFKVFGETCPQYLLFSIEKYSEPDFEGAKYVMSPPLREKGNQEALWQGLAGGDLQAVGTDHCPFNFAGQKEMGRDNFAAIPNGMPGIETRLPLIYHFGVNGGRFSINRFVELVSTGPARLFGLLPRKGTIAIGADADLVIWDPNKKHKLTRENLHMNVDYSPYEDITVKGYPALVMQRGEVIVRENQFVGQVGAGEFLRRAPVRL
ncbi:MAG: dihydropyrimidinase [Candidatus Acetothermia bacterium]|jgi:dihydropyrimidinase|nr:dihydropyrimidinase [Candidatus Acetothermia bacterium]MDH7504687.1 dihydropyrimidinase [Candidatus Acetothermia bacterium]